MLPSGQGIRGTARKSTGSSCGLPSGRATYNKSVCLRSQERLDSLLDIQFSGAAQWPESPLPIPRHARGCAVRLLTEIGSNNPVARVLSNKARLAVAARRSTIRNDVIRVPNIRKVDLVRKDSLQWKRPPKKQD